MHRFLARAQPSFDSILLVESGPRKVTEQILPFLYNVKHALHIDVLTCYNSAPASFDFERGIVYSVNDPEARHNRPAFLRELYSSPYTALAILCTGSPILEKWKWVLALRASARVLLVTDGANYFSLDVWNLTSVRSTLLKRLNPFESSLWEAFSSNMAGLLLFPFTLCYLITFTGAIHLRRWFRTRKPLSS